MQIKSNKAGMPILYAVGAGVGIGFSYAAIDTFDLSLTGNVLSTICILGLLYFIFSRGRSSSWSQAQAWAQNEVNVAVEVYNQAAAKAEALSMAYASAISNAHANATNNITIELPNGEKKTLTQQEFEGIINASRDAQPSRVSMGDEQSQELEALWQSTDS